MSDRDRQGGMNSETWKIRNQREFYYRTKSILSKLHLGILRTSPVHWERLVCLVNKLNWGEDSLWTEAGKKETDRFWVVLFFIEWEITWIFITIWYANSPHFLVVCVCVCDAQCCKCVGNIWTCVPVHMHVKGKARHWLSSSIDFCLVALRQGNGNSPFWLGWLSSELSGSSPLMLRLQAHTCITF